MQYQIDAFKMKVNEKKTLKEAVCLKYHLRSCDVTVLSRSIDARDKTDIQYVYRLLVQTDEKLSGKQVRRYIEQSVFLKYPSWSCSKPPVVVGFGPSGMLAALYLARCHAKPIIIERGKKASERQNDIERFFKDKILDENSNIQFGEGGAGTFSDGKLTTNRKDPLNRFLLEEMVKHGAPDDILWDAMPHIGTDYLIKMVQQIRQEIIALGGTFYFETCFCDAFFNEDSWTVCCRSNEKEYTFSTEHLLLGIGHSAKDTLRYLYRKMQLHMEPKSFSMGVRIEHPRQWIDTIQYGAFRESLPAAYYKLAHHSKDRGIYTFCMCPGGVVVASASEPKTIVTNGMSDHNRSGRNSNSALLVEVRPSDYVQKSVLDGLDFQEKYERLAFQVSGDYRAPANLVREFLNDEVAHSLRSVFPSYPHGIVLTDLRTCLPDFVIAGLKEGLIALDRKMNGFAHPDAVLTGIESRSSCPVRIVRDETHQASRKGIYPIGEGAGYAGGIMSAALDGLKTAIQIANKNKEEKTLDHAV